MSDVLRKSSSANLLGRCRPSCCVAEGTDEHSSAVFVQTRGANKELDKESSCISNATSLGYLDFKGDHSMRFIPR